MMESRVSPVWPIAVGTSWVNMVVAFRMIESGSMCLMASYIRLGLNSKRAIGRWQRSHAKCSFLTGTLPSPTPSAPKSSLSYKLLTTTLFCTQNRLSYCKSLTPYKLSIPLAFAMSVYISYINLPNISTL